MEKCQSGYPDISDILALKASGRRDGVGHFGRHRTLALLRAHRFYPRQQSGIIADWAVQNGSKKAVMILSDWAPGAEAGKVFQANFSPAVKDPLKEAAAK